MMFAHHIGTFSVLARGWARRNQASGWRHSAIEGLLLCGPSCCWRRVQSRGCCLQSQGVFRHLADANAAFKHHTRSLPFRLHEEHCRTKSVVQQGWQLWR